MFSTQTEQKINEVLALELVNACKRYGPDFNSNHEAYAVLLEEVEELEKELDYIKNHLAMIWDYVKVDDDQGIKSNARIISLDVVDLMAEAAQVAAVCRKIIGEGANA